VDAPLDDYNFVNIVFVVTKLNVHLVILLLRERFYFYVKFNNNGKNKTKLKANYFTASKKVYLIWH
jgi:hypothetical protein